MKNEWKNDIIKTINSLEKPVLLIKGVSKTIQNRRTKNRAFLNVIKHFSDRLLGNLFAGKGIIRAGERTIRAGQDF